MIRSVKRYKNARHRMNGMLSLFENYWFPARKVNLGVRHTNMRSIMEYNKMHV